MKSGSADESTNKPLTPEERVVFHALHFALIVYPSPCDSTGMLDTFRWHGLALRLLLSGLEPWLVQRHLDLHLLERSLRLQPFIATIGLLKTSCFRLCNQQREQKSFSLAHLHAATWMTVVNRATHQSLLRVAQPRAHALAGKHTTPTRRDADLKHCSTHVVIFAPFRRERPQHC